MKLDIDFIKKQRDYRAERQIRALDTVTSTNAVLRELAKAGEPEERSSSVEVRGEGPAWLGRALGVDREGHLVPRDPRGKQRRVLAGEVRLFD